MRTFKLLQDSIHLCSRICLIYGTSTLLIATAEARSCESLWLEYLELPLRRVDQRGNSDCSLTSVWMIADSWDATFYPLQKREIFEAAVKTHDPDWFIRSQENGRGTTLSEFKGETERALQNWGYSVHVQIFYGSQFKSGEGLWTFLQNNLSNPNVRMIANFYQGDLPRGEKVGHFAPIGGLQTDHSKVIITDPDPSFAFHTIGVEKLWKMMKTIDGDSGQERGLLRIERIRSADSFNRGDSSAMMTQDEYHP